MGFLAPSNYHFGKICAGSFFFHPHHGRNRRPRRSHWLDKKEVKKTEPRKKGPNGCLGYIRG